MADVSDLGNQEITSQAQVNSDHYQQTGLKEESSTQDFHSEHHGECIKELEHSEIPFVLQGFRVTFGAENPWDPKEEEAVDRREQHGDRHSEEHIFGVFILLQWKL